MHETRLRRPAQAELVRQSPYEPACFVVGRRRTPGDEGDTFNFNGVATDPAGGLTVLTYFWNFGDGTPEVSGVDLTNVSHVYGDDGNYTLTLTVRNSNTGVATRTLAVAVNNVDPTITAFNVPAGGQQSLPVSLNATATVDEVADGIVKLNVETTNQDGAVVLSGYAEARVD